MPAVCPSKSKAKIYELYDQQSPLLPDPSQYLLREDIKQVDDSKLGSTLFK